MPADSDVWMAVKHHKTAVEVRPGSRSGEDREDPVIDSEKSHSPALVREWQQTNLQPTHRHPSPNVGYGRVARVARPSGSGVLRPLHRQVSRPAERRELAADPGIEKYVTVERATDD